jgi:putative ABC transport system permease protein
MKTKTTPPRLAEMLLRIVLSREDAEVVAGDLEESLRTCVAPRRGARAARRWYWHQAIGIVWAHLREPAWEPEERRPGRSTVPSLRQDLAFAVRSLRKGPAFTTEAVLMLALGIGANIAIFALVNALMLKPLPFADPDRLMLVQMLMPDRDAPGVLRPGLWSWPKYRVLRDEQQVFESTAIFGGREWNVTGSGSPERVPIELVEWSYFHVLGVAPQVGRAFSAQETGTPGSAPLAVLGHGFWVRRFGSDPTVVGRTIGLNGTPHTILGVLPSGFRGLTGQGEIWVPLMTVDKEELEGAHNHSYRVVARRGPEISVQEARAAVTVLGQRVDAQYPDGSRAPWAATAVPLDDERVDPLVRRSVLLLLAAVAAVLLIVCVNLANLTLARGFARQREVAIRLALGAGRLRIVRQLMTENMLLAAIGAGGGLAVAYVAVSGAAVLMPDLDVVLNGRSVGLTRAGLNLLGFDGATLLFTVAVATLATMLFGLGPAWSASRRDLSATLKAGGAGAVSAGGRGFDLRNGLLVAEMALALVLLAAGGVMIKSVVRLQATELGFNPGGLLTFRLMLFPPQYDPERATQLFEALLDRLDREPAVQSVGYGSCAPVSGGCNSTLASFPDRPPFPPGRAPIIGVFWASPRYFETLGIRLVRGRFFTERDSVGRPKVTIVNETAARTFWPGQDPIGKRIGIRQGGFQDGAEVVGVVADVRYGEVERAVAPDVHIPLLQSRRQFGVIFVRSRSTPAALAPVIRRELAALDSDLPIVDMKPMEARLGDAIWRTRMSAWLLGVFSGLALLLAALGIYGVMSQGVTQRSREIGVRIALGADRADILRLVLRRVLAVSMAGIVVGVILAWPALQALSGLLYEVSPRDPFVLATLSSVLLAVALLAGYLPARRAARVDPLTTMRVE